MAIIGGGLAGALLIPMAAMAFIFISKRSASNDGSDDMPPETERESAAPEAQAAGAEDEPSWGWR
jgi:hypothetical protein